MPSPLASLFGKLVVLTGVGGSSALYFGVPDSTEGNRKYSLNLNLGTKELGLTADLFEKSELTTWTGNRSTYQGVNTEKIKGLFAQSNRSIYKLVQKSEWTPAAKDNVNNPQIKGAFGLVKITWTKNTDSEKVSEGKIEEIQVDESNRVWLIIAQGKVFTYLIPVVRASGWLEEEKHCEKTIGPKSLAMSVLAKGISDISKWIGENDGHKVWNSEQNTRLKTLMQSGFSIWRGRDAFLPLEKPQVTNLFKNAGVLLYRKADNQPYKSCTEVEKYFPLDLVVIGDKSKIRGHDERDTWTLPIQRIQSTETIQNVMGVRLDQAIIDNEGISDGQGNKITWNEKFKPTITLEVRK